MTEAQSVAPSLPSQSSTAALALSPSLPPPSQHHALASGFTFWYLNKKAAAATADEHAYEEAIKKMATFRTVEEFWCVYSHLLRPNDLPSAINIHLFREGIRPMWEDPNNAQGGKLTLRIKKGLSSRLWEDVLLCVIGDSFGLGEEICGAVLVTKNNEDVLSIWNRTATDRNATNRIRETLKRVLDLPNNAPLDYKPHSEVMNRPHKQ